MEYKTKKSFGSLKQIMKLCVCVLGLVLVLSHHPLPLLEAFCDLRRGLHEQRGSSCNPPTMDTAHNTRHRMQPRLVVYAHTVLLLVVVMMVSLNLQQQVVRGQEAAAATTPAAAGGECTCRVRFVGEYCGITLNEQDKTQTNNCTTDMYFCGKSNLHQKAVVLKPCPQKGFECNKKLNGGELCISLPQK